VPQIHGAGRSFKTSVNKYQTTRRNIPEDCISEVQNVAIPNLHIKY